MSREIYVTRGGLYPQDAWELMERAGSQARLAPLGGGFVIQVPAEDLKERFVRRNPTTTETPYRAVRVTGDWLPDDETLSAFTQGYRWNGWATPCFEKAAAERLVELGLVDYDPAMDAYTRPADEDSPAEVYEAQMIVVEGRARKVYAIGSGVWCWELIG